MLEGMSENQTKMTEKLDKIYDVLAGNPLGGDGLIREFRAHVLEEQTREFAHVAAEKAREVALSTMAMTAASASEAHTEKQDVEKRAVEVPSEERSSKHDNTRKLHIRAVEYTWELMRTPVGIVLMAFATAVATLIAQHFRNADDVPVSATVDHTTALEHPKESKQ